jgi:hypothetical protein
MREDERTAFFIPGNANAVERVLEQCRRENGGRLVGNPTVQKPTGFEVEGGDKVSIVIIEDDADRAGWWREYSRVHGYTWKRRPADQTDSPASTQPNTAA